MCFETAFFSLKCQADSRAFLPAEWLHIWLGKQAACRCGRHPGCRGGRRLHAAQQWHSCCRRCSGRDGNSTGTGTQTALLRGERERRKRDETDEPSIRGLWTTSQFPTNTMCDARENTTIYVKLKWLLPCAILILNKQINYIFVTQISLNLPTENRRNTTCSQGEMLQAKQRWLIPGLSWNMMFKRSWSPQVIFSLYFCRSGMRSSPHRSGTEVISFWWAEKKKKTLNYAKPFPDFTAWSGLEQITTK